MSLRELRLVYLGMSGPLSLIPLERLLLNGIEPIAIITPSPDESPLPIRVLSAPPPLRADLRVRSARPNLLQFAWQQDIPLLAVTSLRHAQTLELLAELKPDLIVVSCFPFLLPLKLLHIPTEGCWNVHPSLLPRLRGPEPLFWMFHEGVAAGVSLHQMSRRLDAGDIIMQKVVALPDGVTYAEAEHVCAQWGARLLVDAINTQMPLQKTPQDERDASYFPKPTADDFIITPAWAARRAFNFVRGMQGYGEVTLQIGAERWRVQDAARYATGVEMHEAYHADGALLQVRFVDGIVWLRVMGDEG